VVYLHDTDDRQRIIAAAVSDLAGEKRPARCITGDRIVFTRGAKGTRTADPCLQSTARLSSTVYGLARSGLLDPSAYSNVQVCWCRLWVSSPGFAFSTWADRCEDDQGARRGGRVVRQTVSSRDGPA
jgi:hypothetical protein